MVNFELATALGKLERETPKPGTDEARHAMNFLIGVLHGNQARHTVIRVAKLMSKLINGTLE